MEPGLPKKPSKAATFMFSRRKRRAEFLALHFKALRAALANRKTEFANLSVLGSFSGCEGVRRLSGQLATDYLTRSFPLTEIGQ
jgi:hypothetical protein